MRPRLLSPFLVLVALLIGVWLPPTPTAAGDEDPAGDLQSEDPRLVAWGAWHAAEQERADAGPEIEAQLIWALTQDEPQLEHLLDAAIRLGVRLPQDTLVRLARIRPTAAAILCCRHQQNAPQSVLAVFDVLRAGGYAWTAVGNALARWRTPGFAARVLRDLELRRTVRATDGATLRPFRAPYGSVRGCGVIRRRPGWPPRVTYELALEPPSDVLSAGRHAVYLRREVILDEAGFGYTAGGDEPSADDCRVAWLGIDIPATGVVDLLYVGRQPWRRALDSLAETLRAHVFARVRILRFDRRLTHAEARAVRPRVVLTVVDRRGDKRHPLPTFELAPARNPWAGQPRR